MRAGCVPLLDRRILDEAQIAVYDRLRDARHRAHVEVREAVELELDDFLEMGLVGALPEARI